MTLPYWQGSCLKSVVSAPNTSPVPGSPCPLLCIGRQSGDCVYFVCAPVCRSLINRALLLSAGQLLSLLPPKPQVARATPQVLTILATNISAPLPSLNTVLQLRISTLHHISKVARVAWTGVFGEALHAICSDPSNI